MIKLSSQMNHSSGDINYLIIEYLKSIPFYDPKQKEQLIKNVRKKYLIFRN